MRYHLSCVTCGTQFEPSEVNFFKGCPVCADTGRNSNFSVEPMLDSIMLTSGDLMNLYEPHAPGLWGWGALLPVKPEGRISLHEGQTPLIKLERFGQRIGVPELYIKDESRNPTWSYKDRLCAVAVSKGVEAGAEVITVSSTGNHGASAAAYAARAGLPCVVFTTATVPDVMKTLMQSYGAAVVALESPWDRWKLMGQVVDRYGWYPVSGYQFPPIGSNPFGIEGYKTLSLETWQQLGKAPQWVAVPTCYGDGLIGVWKGWQELRNLGAVKTTPRMIAAEVYGSLGVTLQKGHDNPVQVDTGATPAFSINTPVGTHQSMLALRQSRGVATAVKDIDLITMQKHLAADEGIYAEASAVAALAAIQAARQAGTIKEADVAVAILTSTGLKDPLATAETLPTVPVINPDIDELAGVLSNVYGTNVSLS